VSAENAPALLAPRLEQILQSLPEKAFAGRLRKVYAAAAQAIARLSDMDLVKYETETTESGADLSLWEEMAPVIRDTVVDVNSLLNVIREQFPAQPRGGPEAGPLQQKAREVSAALQEGMTEMAQQITQLGEAMRNPSVVSDRWMLLAEVQRFRSTFREHIGNLVFATSSSFADVARKEVVPGYEADVKAAMTVRAIVADLGRILAARLTKVRDARPEELQGNAQQLQNELDAFGRTHAYRGLRAQDKRHIIEVRGRMGKLAIQDNPRKAEVLAAVEELDTIMRALSNVNQRQLLIAHDREVWAGCGVRLERALSLLGSEPTGAARALADAAASAQSLYGRESRLDAFLRKVRKVPLAQLTGAELRTTIETLQSLLASLDTL
jgi:hypothetical protein